MVKINSKKITEKFDKELRQWYDEFGEMEVGPIQKTLTVTTKEQIKGRVLVQYSSCELVKIQLNPENIVELDWIQLHEWFNDKEIKRIDTLLQRDENKENLELALGFNRWSL